MKIGVISDTHNHLDARVAGLFSGVDHILHGGDVGSGKIILDLERIAPVTAVLGNTDDPAQGWRLTEVVEVEGWRFLVHHIVNPHALTDSLSERIQREKPHAVIFGHTHKPFCQLRDGRLFFNPGYAGKPRFGLERSVAILEQTPEGLQPHWFQL